MKKKSLWSIVLIAGALLLSACNIQINTDIGADGSGRYGFEMGFNPEDQEALAGLGSSAEQFCADMQAEGDLPQGAEIVTEQRGDDVVCVMSQPFGSLDELRALYAEGDGITVNTLEITNGALVYDVDVLMNTEDTGSTAAIAMTWQVTVPGSVGDNNADSVDGNTLVWTLTPGQSRNIRVESTTGGLGFGGADLTTILGVLCSCLCCVGLLAGAGGGLYWFTQRNKQK